MTSIRRKFSNSVPLILGVCLCALTIGAQAAPPAAKRPAEAPTSAEATRAADIFGRDAWHAVEQSWPGTLRFDPDTKKVELAPLGGERFYATYSYTLDDTSSRKGGSHAQTGSLTMTAAGGRTSVAHFSLEGRRLSLQFPQLSGVREEQYLRMTPEEEAEERKRIEKLLGVGK